MKCIKMILFIHRKNKATNLTSTHNVLVHQNRQNGTQKYWSHKGLYLTSAIHMSSVPDKINEEENSLFQCRLLVADRLATVHKILVNIFIFMK